MDGIRRGPLFRFTCASGDTEAQGDALFSLYIQGFCVACWGGLNPDAASCRRETWDNMVPGPRPFPCSHSTVLQLVQRRVQTRRKLRKSVSQLTSPSPPPKSCSQEQHPDHSSDRGVGRANACCETFRRAMLVEAGLSSERNQETKYERCACMARAWTTKHIYGNRSALLGVGIGVFNDIPSRFFFIWLLTSIGLQSPCGLGFSLMCSRGFHFPPSPSARDGTRRGGGRHIDQRLATRLD